MQQGITVGRWLVRVMRVPPINDLLELSLGAASAQEVAKGRAEDGSVLALGDIEGWHGRAQVFTCHRFRPPRWAHRVASTSVWSGPLRERQAPECAGIDL